MSLRPDPETLRWAAGQVLASGPATPDTTPLYCAGHYIRQAAQRLRGHAQWLDRNPAEGDARLAAIREASTPSLVPGSTARYVSMRDIERIFAATQGED